MLELIPGNREILDRLHTSIDGPYTVVHHAWVPYVRIRPATAREPIIIRATPGLILCQGTEKRLQGTETVDFAIIFAGDSTRLQELPYRATALDAYDQAPVPPLKVEKPRRLTPVSPSVPNDIAEDVPDALAALIVREDVHPDLGDYLVLPSCQAEAYPSLPRWVAVSPHVETMRVVKPRVGSDEQVTHGE